MCCMTYVCQVIDPGCLRLTPAISRCPDLPGAMTGVALLRDRAAFVHLLSRNRPARSAHRRLDGSGGLPEQDGAFFGGADAALVRIDVLDQRIGAHHRRTRRDGVEPALDMREIR